MQQSAMRVLLIILVLCQASIVMDAQILHVTVYERSINQDVGRMEALWQ